MSRTSTITITSDLTGKSVTYPTEAEAPKPVKITLNGKSGQIDLAADELAALEALISTGDAAELRKLISPAVAVTVPGRTRTRRGGGTSSGKSASPELSKIREWGRANGFEVPDRGRLPKTLTDAYSAAHGHVSEPTSEPASEPASEPGAADAA